jgi:hypothetical protein
MRKHLPVFAIFIISMFSYSEENIAILDLDAKGVDETEANILTDRLRAELFLTGKYKIIERQKMQDILKEQGFQQSGCTSNECMVEVGQLIGVQKIVGGSISKFRSIYSITARIIDVKTGQIENTATFDHEGAMEELLKTGIKTIALKLVASSKKLETPAIADQKDTHSKPHSNMTISGGITKWIIPFSYLDYRTDSSSGNGLLNVDGGNCSFGITYGKNHFECLFNIGTSNNNAVSSVYVTSDETIIGGGISWLYDVINSNNRILGLLGLNMGYWQNNEKLFNYQGDIRKVSYQSFGGGVLRLKMGIAGFYMFAEYMVNVGLFSKYDVGMYNDPTYLQLRDYSHPIAHIIQYGVSVDL